uniref:Uncharacterized protein n=1 Tax=Anguilla anguilla TaxID=7936 RepID=A0A0E9SNW6_ANGAN
MGSPRQRFWGAPFLSAV